MHQAPDDQEAPREGRELDASDDEPTLPKTNARMDPTTSARSHPTPARPDPHDPTSVTKEDQQRRQRPYHPESQHCLATGPHERHLQAPPASTSPLPRPSPHSPASLPETGMPRHQKSTERHATPGMPTHRKQQAPETLPSHRITTPKTQRERTA